LTATIAIALVVNGLIRNEKDLAAVSVDEAFVTYEVISAKIVV